MKIGFEKPQRNSIFLYVEKICEMRNIKSNLNYSLILQEIVLAYSYVI